MPNELLWFTFLAIDLCFALFLFRRFGRIGLYALIVLDIIICNIQVVKVVEIFGLVTTLGNILYASIFFATDVLGEVYGKRAAREGVWLGFAALLGATLFMQLALRFHPHPDDFAHGALATIFSFTPRVAVASIIAYLVSQHHDVWSFHRWKSATKGKHLWLRNNASTFVSQLADSIVFTTIAFWGVFSAGIFWQLLLTTYVMKLLVAALDTPFVYLAVRMSRGEADGRKTAVGAHPEEIHP